MTHHVLAFGLAASVAVSFAACGGGLGDLSDADRTKLGEWLACSAP